MEIRGIKREGNEGIGEREEGGKWSPHFWVEIIRDSRGDI